MPSLSAEPADENATVSGDLPEVGVAAAAAVGATLGTTVIVVVSEAVAPSSSVTVSETTCGPSAVKTYEGVGSVEVAPPPKSQRYDTTVPSESVEPVPSKSTASGALPVVGSATMTAVGAALTSETEMMVVAVDDRPPLSVTFSDAVNVPCEVYVWVASAVVSSGEPSPKSHS